MGWGGKSSCYCPLQDLISLDTSPAKERLEESCGHPLEEAMLGCDMDGEAHPV